MTIDEAIKLSNNLRDYLAKSKNWDDHGYVVTNDDPEGIIYYHKDSFSCVYRPYKDACWMIDCDWVKAIKAARDTVLREDPEAAEFLGDAK